VNSTFPTPLFLDQVPIAGASAASADKVVSKPHIFEPNPTFATGGFLKSTVIFLLSICKFSRFSGIGLINFYCIE